MPMALLRETGIRLRVVRLQPSVIPEGSESDFSAHVQQVMLAAWQEVSNSEDFTSEPEQLESDESQQMIFAAVEQAAAGIGRRGTFGAPLQ